MNAQVSCNPGGAGGSSPIVKARVAAHESFETLFPGERNELEMSTVLIRYFLGITPDEFIELTALVDGKPRVWQCRTLEQHLEGLRLAHSLRGFSGAYMLVNGPVNPDLSARYEQCRWVWGRLRATDKDICERRGVYIDVDPIRVSGISATNGEHECARDVAWSVRDWLSPRLGQSCLGLGCSGNGFFVLIALEPTSSPSDSSPKIQRFLALLAKKFGTDRVSIDTTVFNPARLMSCPGTWKRKGISTPDRPHRMTTFTCHASSVDRIALEAL